MTAPVRSGSNLMVAALIGMFFTLHGLVLLYADAWFGPLVSPVVAGGAVFLAALGVLPNVRPGR